MHLVARARAAVLLALGVALGGCGDAPTARAPDAASNDEERAVAEAAEMLEERVPDAPPTPDDGAEDGNK